MANNPNFANVLHAYNGGANNAGILTDLQGGATFQMTERASFMGYNLLNGVGNPVSCAEASWYFYNQYTNSCNSN